MMSEIEPRIIGTETEWSINYRQLDQYRLFKRLPITDARGKDLYRVYRDEFDGHVAKDMISNGGRLYPDSGESLEYATPENTSIMDAVISEMAGERIAIACMIRHLHQRANDISDIAVNKRVIDDHGRSAGYHVNLSANPMKVNSRLSGTFQPIGLHMATAQPMLGAGAIINIGDDQFEYSYSQKISSVRSDVRGSTMEKEKPLINCRNEPLDYRKKHTTRFHLTSADAHISPWASWMTIGTNSLVLRAIEQNRVNDINIANYNDYSMVKIAHNAMIHHGDKDPDSGLIRLKTGTLTHLEMQQKLLEAASKTEHTDEEHEVLKEWERAVVDMEQDIMLLRDRSDAIARLSLLNAYARRNGLDQHDYSNYGMRRTDLSYDGLVNISQDTPISADKSPSEFIKSSFAHKLRTTLFAEYMPTEDDIVEAIYEPPRTTRAYRRGKAIQQGNVPSASWIDFYVRENDDDEPVRHMTDDPYDKEYLRSLDSIDKDDNPTD